MKELANRLGQPAWAIGALIIVVALIVLFGFGEGNWLLGLCIAVVVLVGIMWGFRQSVIVQGRKEAGQLTRTAEVRGMPYKVEYDEDTMHYFLVTNRKEYDLGKGANVQNRLYEYIRLYSIYQQLP